MLGLSNDQITDFTLATLREARRFYTLTRALTRNNQSPMRAEEVLNLNLSPTRRRSGSDKVGRGEKLRRNEPQENANY